MLVKLSSLHRALERNQLVPSFQPLVELRTGRLKGFEVLARCRHPHRGLILPENFIALSEEHGLITELTRQVFRKAFKAARHLPTHLTLAVNVSPIQLSDLTLARQIQDLAEEARFSPHRLTVEITESAIVGNIERAKTILGDLKAMGCRLALDDFGTGYSNLRHLQMLPLDELKVDRSFVAMMTQSRESRKIVAAIVGLGHSLGLVTVAEGIETMDQANAMLRLGCERGQGWLYGRPIPAKKLPEVIAASPRSALPALPLRVAGTPEVSSLEAFPTQQFAQLRAIYDGAPVGLCFLDTKLRYVSLNERLATMNGSSVEWHLGREVEEILGEVFAIYEPYLRRALAGEAINGVEVKRPGLMPGDPERTTLASYQPARDEMDEIIGISVSVLDTTNLKRTNLRVVAQTGSETNKRPEAHEAHHVRDSAKVA